MSTGWPTSKMMAYYALREPLRRHSDHNPEMALSIQDDHNDRDQEDIDNVDLSVDRHPLKQFVRSHYISLFIVIISLTSSILYYSLSGDGTPANAALIAMPGILVASLFLSTIIEHLFIRILIFISDPDSSTGTITALRSRIRFVVLFGVWHLLILPRWRDLSIDSVQVVFRGGFVISVSWVVKELFYGLIRKFATVNTLKSDLQVLTAIKDTIWMICCPDASSRARLLKSWRRQSLKKSSFDHKVRELRDCVMVLPLVPTSDGNEWMFDEEASLRVTSTSKMRTIAQFISKRLFCDGYEISFQSWCHLFSTTESAGRSWSLFFKDAPDTRKIHADDFIWAFIQAFEHLVHLSNRASNLDNLLSVVLIALNTIFYLVITSYLLVYVLGVNLSAMVVTFATAFASLTFAFSGMITRVFESMIWVFVTKSVEVGDLIQFNSQDFTVLRIRLMSSDLRSGDGRVMNIPNGLLAQSPIYNMRMTSHATVAVKFQVAYSCSNEQLAMLRKNLEAYVVKNSEIWRAPIDLRVSDLLDQSSWTITAVIQHRLNWQQRGIIADDQFEITNEIRRWVNDLQIGFKDPDVYVDKSSMMLPLPAAGDISKTDPNY
uniref:Mechanosensitive ion channel MscS domain-containing protein n=1 Tax=Spongospora subterranea TaxID=70186 RepID=A0A0H5RCN0_9EUKA|eukprot:CRZ11337.1 hypothetical protein [Spongospora subterranea]